MSIRAQRLHELARADILRLERQLLGADGSRLAQPCPGREKLGDGTIAAVAAHTVDRYLDIARFVAGGPSQTAGHGGGEHDQRPATAVEFAGSLNRLRAARRTLEAGHDLSDEHLDSIPAADAIRFADGQRALAEVIEKLLRHQRHQVDAVVAALSDH